MIELIEFKRQTTVAAATAAAAAASVTESAGRLSCAQWITEIRDSLRNWIIYKTRRDGRHIGIGQENHTPEPMQLVT